MDFKPSQWRHRAGIALVMFVALQGSGVAETMLLRPAGECHATHIHNEGSAYYIGPQYIQCPGWDGHSLGNTITVQGDTQAIRLTMWAINTNPFPDGTLILACHARRYLADEIIMPMPKLIQHELLFTFDGQGPTRKRATVILPIEGRDGRENIDIALAEVQCHTRRGTNLWRQVDSVYLEEQAWVEEIPDITEKQ